MPRKLVRKPKAEAQDRRVRIVNDSELAVLGAALTDKASRRQVVALVRPEDFLDDRNRALFRAVIAMAESDQPFHEDTVAAHAGPREEWGGFEHLRQIVSDYGRPLESIDFHAGRMRFAVLRKDLAKPVVEELIELAAKHDAGPEDVVAFAERLWGRASAMTSVRASDAPAVVGRAREHLKAASEGRQRFVSIECGVMDGMLAHGLVPGKSTVAGARPGCGKTTWAVRLAGLRAEKGRGTCFVACETEEYEIGLMMASRALGLPYTVLLQKPQSLPKPDQQRVQDYLDSIAHSGLFEVVTDAHMTARRRDPGEKFAFGSANERALDRLEAVVSRTPHQLVVVDLIGYFIPEQKVELIDRALMRVKTMAKRHGVHMLLLHHLKRADPRVGRNARPTMDDLRASGGFEQYLDNILLMHRPKRGQKRTAEQSKKRDVLELHVVKQRGGPEIAVLYDFVGEHCDLDNARIAPFSPTGGSDAGYDEGTKDESDVEGI